MNTPTPPNTFYRFAPNAWLAKCASQHKKGETIDVYNKHGRPIPHVVFKEVGKRSGYFFYSILRVGQSYAEKKAEKYLEWAKKARDESNAEWEKSRSALEHIIPGQPIIIGHHSERKHRGAIERSNNSMRNSIESDNRAKAHEGKAEYWRNRAKTPNLGEPESLEYYKYMLENAENKHTALKKQPETREHIYSLAYAKKAVNDYKKLLKLAQKLWEEDDD